MRILMVIALLLSSITPAYATLLVRTGPTLAEIQAGIDACKAGDEQNCKYERYAGVAGKGTGKQAPYILGDQLEDGTVLPKVSDRLALIKALVDGDVEIVAFRTTDSAILLASWSAEPTTHALVIPSHIVELAYQNGISAHEMYLHIETNLKVGAREAGDIVNDHTAFILAIGSNFITIDQEQIDAKVEQLEELQKLYAEGSYQNEALKGVIDDLQEHLETLTDELAFAAIANDLLRQKIAQAVNNGNSEIETALEGVTDSAARSRIVKELADGGNAVAQLAILNAINVTTPIVSDATINAAKEKRGGYNYVELFDELNPEGVVINNVPYGSLDEVYRETARFWVDVFQRPQITDPAYWAAFNIAMSTVLTWTETFVEAAYADGYKDGYNDGYEQGYQDGYRDGFVDGVNSVRDTLQEE